MDTSLYQWRQKAHHYQNEERNDKYKQNILATLDCVVVSDICTDRRHSRDMEGEDDPGGQCGQTATRQAEIMSVAPLHLCFDVLKFVSIAPQCVRHLECVTNHS